MLGRQGVAKPLRGIVRYRLPGTKKFVRLTELTAIPNGTEIDARKGRLLLTVLHDASGRLDGAGFYAGRFIFRQGKGATPRTTLKLTGGSFKNCTRNVAEGEPRGTSGLARPAKPNPSSPWRRAWRTAPARAPGAGCASSGATAAAASARAAATAPRPCAGPSG